MTDSPDCIHELDLCPTCQGLRVTRMERLDGAALVEFNAGPFSYSGPVDLYIGPTPEPCPGEAADEETP